MTFQKLIWSLDYNEPTAAMMAAADFLEEEGQDGSVEIRKLVGLINKIDIVIKEVYKWEGDFYIGGTGRFVDGPISIYHNAVVFPIRNFDGRWRGEPTVVRTHHIYPACSNITGAVEKVFHPQVTDLLRAYNFFLNYRRFNLIQEVACDYHSSGQISMPVLIMGNKFGFLG